MTARAPRKMIELRNALVCIREAMSILDLTTGLRSDPTVMKEADELYNVYRVLIDRLEEMHTETGHGYEVEADIEIINKVVFEDETLAEIDRALQENV